MILISFIGKKSLSYEPGEQTIYVKNIHVHPLYMEGKPDNDLAVVELKDKIGFKNVALPACLPEKDFADSVLMSGAYMGMVTGWKDSSEFQGNLRLNHVSYDKLPSCIERHSGKVSICEFINKGKKLYSSNGSLNTFVVLFLSWPCGGLVPPQCLGIGSGYQRP